MSLPSISVVIPARDAAQTLPAQLAALAPQLRSARGEVIVVDNRSTDETSEVAQMAFRRLGIEGRVLAAGERDGPSYARNRGASVAVGELVLFCDADDVVGPAWVAELTRALAENDVVGGPAYEGQAAPRRSGGAVWFMSGSLGVRRSFFDHIGGFNEDLPVAEDLEFGIRAARAGAKMAFVPSATLQTRGRRATTRALIRQRYLYGYWTARAERRLGIERSRNRDLLWVVSRFPFVITAGARRRYWISRAAGVVGRYAGRWAESREEGWGALQSKSGQGM